MVLSARLPYDNRQVLSLRLNAKSPYSSEKRIHD
uniref:Uncharacterized protein n=2 Tax=unclassified Caudoviricetes TaxID=2788787 RepID=A0A8S5TEB7_9CAUD|nr:MAG TPA: hypothetical protein [Podoviridae sp. ctIi96]DAF61488.1 MAG TPA: hypothetical protein [Podoviridae sp. ctzXp5]DAH30893.1 MAG TPA: hypothetical protein [Caudoviricetes sp.]DAP48300.1 MAG TPA: hypothetical protein [Caudoviricetes sp.]DAS37313.1 MAG TPA: hypothetical protein [Caudoviricetes sp.]